MIVINEDVHKGRWLLTIGFCIACALFCLYGLGKIATWTKLPSVATNQVNFLVFVVLLGTLAALGLIIFTVQALILLSLAFRVELLDERIVAYRLLGPPFAVSRKRFTREIRVPLLDLAASSNVVICHVLLFGMRWFAVVDRGESTASLLQALRR